MNTMSAVRSNRPKRGFSASSPLAPEFHTPVSEGQPLSRNHAVGNLPHPTLSREGRGDLTIHAPSVALTEW